MASMLTCPHAGDKRLPLSGTKLRKMLSDGSEIPGKFSRLQVLSILREHYTGPKDEDKVEIELSGLSAR